MPVTTVVLTTSFDREDFNVTTLYYFNACRIKISRLVQIKLFTKIASKIFLLPIFSRSTSVTVVPWGSGVREGELKIPGSQL